MYHTLVFTQNLMNNRCRKKFWRLSDSLFGSCLFWDLTNMKVPSVVFIHIVRKSWNISGQNRYPIFFICGANIAVEYYRKRIKSCTGVLLRADLTQVPCRLFSPSDICKKLSHHFLLHFPIDMGSYDHHAKYQGVFP